MAKKPDLRVRHMLDAISAIQKYTAGKSLEEFREDDLVRSLVERKLEIISEAARHIPENVLSKYPQIPWKSIKGIGNVLRHEYHEVLPAALWAVVEKDLAPLNEAVLTILENSTKKEFR